MSSGGGPPESRVTDRGASSRIAIARRAGLVMATGWRSDRWFWGGPPARAPRAAFRPRRLDRLSRRARASPSASTPGLPPPGSQRRTRPLAVSAASMRPEIGEQRSAGPRAAAIGPHREVAEVERRRHDRLLEDRRAHPDVALRSGDAPSRRRTACPLRSRPGSTARRRHPVLLRDRRAPGAPSAQRSPDRGSRRRAARCPRRRRRADEDDLRAVERGDGPAERMPGVLAHEDRRPTPRRVEGAHRRDRARRIAPRRTARRWGGSPFR